MNEQVFTITTSACAGIIGDLDAVAQQRADHDFGVYQVLGAAQGDHANPHGALCSILFHQIPSSLSHVRGVGNVASDE